MTSERKVIESEDDTILVLDFEPKDFPITVTTSAQDFVSSQQEAPNDFKISELVADQVGINQVQRQSIEKQIEERALTRVKEIEERAYREAYELGLIEGTEKAFQMRKAELEERVKDINSLLGLFENIKKRLLIENEQAFVKLATAIASKIAMKEIIDQEDTILTLLRSVVDELQAEDTIHVKISDEDLFFLESLREKTDNQIDLLDRLKLESSDEIATGGCIVETNNGTVDARIKNRIEKAWELMDSKLPKYKDKTGTDGLPIDSSKIKPAEKADDSSTGTDDGSDDSGESEE